MARNQRAISDKYIGKPTIMGKFLLKGILLLSGKLCICWQAQKRTVSHEGTKFTETGWEGENSTCGLVCSKDLRMAWRKIDTSINTVLRAGMMRTLPLLLSLGSLARALFTQLLLQCPPRRRLNASLICEACEYQPYTPIKECGWPFLLFMDVHKVSLYFSYKISLEVIAM